MSCAYSPRYGHNAPRPAGDAPPPAWAADGDCWAKRLREEHYHGAKREGEKQLARRAPSRLLRVALNSCERDAGHLASREEEAIVRVRYKAAIVTVLPCCSARRVSLGPQALALRLYEATGGRILLDGTDVTVLDPRFLRQYVTAVQQARGMETAGGTACRLW